MTTKRRKPPHRDGRGTDTSEEDTDMARKSHHALAPGDDAAEQLTPRALTKQEFGRRLQSLLDDRGWNQSDLVRAINIAFPDLDKPFGRDAISTYINGRSFPTPKSLNMLCQALSVTREELLPNSISQAMNDEHPALELRAAAGHPGKAWVKVNRMMGFDTAAQIVQLINEEDKKDFEGR